MSENKLQTPLALHLIDAGFMPKALKECLQKFLDDQNKQYDYNDNDFFEKYLMLKSVEEVKDLL